MGLLTKKDSTLYRGFFKEMAKLRGISVKYYYPVETDVSIHAEFSSKLSDPIDIDIIFDENPKVSTLRKIGWISENPDDKPYLAQLPWDTPYLSTESEIDIPPIDAVGSSRRFKITTIKTLLEFPDSYMCTLAPVFNTKDPNLDYSDSNYNTLKNDDNPHSDAPDNKRSYNYLRVGS